MRASANFEKNMVKLHDNGKTVTNESESLIQELKTNEA